MDQLDSGAALNKFRLLVEAQGGDVRVCEDPAKVLPAAPYRETVSATQSGWLAEAHAGRIGAAAVALGAGRMKKGDPIDPAVGFVLHVKVGDAVRTGDALCEIHAATPDALAQARDQLRAALVVSKRRARPLPLFYQTIH
jgi:pyrimidine-nucleoside phosphorylase